jgi:hypothetical protein
MYIERQGPLSVCLALGLFFLGTARQDTGVETKLIEFRDYVA